MQFLFQILEFVLHVKQRSIAKDVEFAKHEEVPVDSLERGDFSVAWAMVGDGLEDLHWMNVVTVARRIVTAMHAEEFLYSLHP